MANRSTPPSEHPRGRTERKTFDGRNVSEEEAGEGATDTPTIGSEAETRISPETGFDRVVGAEEAGLGGGLDQAEEAQLGVTDEELAELARQGQQPRQ